MSTRTIDPVDTIWLNMDRPDNLMVIESLMMLDGPMDWPRFLGVLERRVVNRYPVFRQRPVESRLPFALPHWEDDPDFSLERHVRRATLAGPGDEATLQDYVNTFLSTPLVRDRPLWEMHLIDGYGEGSAVYSRLHHGMADGIALTQVLLSMSDATVDGDLGEEEPDDGAGPGWFQSAWQSSRTAAGALLDLPHLVTPGHAADALTVVGQSAAVARKLLLTRNPYSPVAGTVGTEKRAIWADPYPLAAVVDAGHRTGTTVNDVLVAALAGAVSGYLRDHHGDAVDVPTMIPVNVRPSDEPLPRELGNKFALVMLHLPTAEMTALQRLAEVHRRMEHIKDSPEALITSAMAEGIGHLHAIDKPLVDFFAGKAIGVTTNVAGPRQSRYLAGVEVSGVLGWVPGSGGQTLGVCIFSYADTIRIGFKVDAAAVPEPELLIGFFEAELDALRAATAER